MKYPDRVQVIVNSLAAKHPNLVHGDDEARRTLTGYFAEQCRFELGAAWGRKRYGNGPVSADVVVYKDSTIFVGWDTQLAGGVIAQWPDSIDLSQDSQQIFVEVAAVDHLGSANPIPSPTPPPIDLVTVLEKLDNLAKELEAVKNILIEEGLAFPDYAGEFRLSYFGPTRFRISPL